jgi:hypothetical protein
VFQHAHSGAADRSEVETFEPVASNGNRAVRFPVRAAAQRV